MQRNQGTLHQYNEESELAIKTWKQAMNAEIAKAMEITLELEEEQQRASMALEHVAMLCPQPEHIRADIDEYISKVRVIHLNF